MQCWTLCTSTIETLSGWLISCTREMARFLITCAAEPMPGPGTIRQLAVGAYEPDRRRTLTRSQVKEVYSRYNATTLSRRSWLSRFQQFCVPSFMHASFAGRAADRVKDSSSLYGGTLKADVGTALLVPACLVNS